MKKLCLPHSPAWLDTVLVSTKKERREVKAERSMEDAEELGEKTE